MATMPRPTTRAGAQALAALLRHPERALLAFDYDGVLSPIVDDPRAARPHPRTLAALAALGPRVGSMAIITGRPAQMVVDFGELGDIAELSGLVVFGHYGLERWDAASGKVVAPPASPGVAAARAELAALLAHLGVGGPAIEDKGSSVAVHTRQSDDPQALLDRLREPLTGFAARHGLIVEPGRFVLELRPPGVDKGAVLRTYVNERAATIVAYSGDDLGDLSAFAAIDAMREEGTAGLKICGGSPEVVEVARQADLVVDGADGIADLVEALAAAIV